MHPIQQYIIYIYTRKRKMFEMIWRWWCRHGLLYGYYLPDRKDEKGKRRNLLACENERGKHWKALVSLSLWSKMRISKAHHHRSERREMMSDGLFCWIHSISYRENVTRCCRESVFVKRLPDVLTIFFFRKIGGIRGPPNTLESE